MNILFKIENKETSSKVEENFILLKFIHATFFRCIFFKYFYHLRIIGEFLPFPEEEVFAELRYKNCSARVPPPALLPPVVPLLAAKGEFVLI